MLFVVGIKVVFLFCIYFVESKKPFGKRQQDIWRLECELGITMDEECPVDGGWSPWSSWSECQGACDYVGHRRRIRECTNPPTSKDGTPCSGPDEQIQTCYIMNCSVEDFQKLIEGDVPRTDALHQLEIVPALLERCLQMECPYEAIEAVLSTDNTWQLSTEVLWNSLQCVKHKVGCSIRGEWGSWGAWSPCGARCGKGLRWRVRRCDSPPPSEANLICSGTPLQSEECVGDQCVIDERYEKFNAEGSWSEWGTWSNCSETCGNGIRRRKRACLESKNPFNSFMWGTHCRGQYEQLEICINNVCSLDGAWSGWGPWGPCSQSCGVGRRSRTRSCTKPLPSGDGRKCEGPKVETGSCYLEPCELYTHMIALLNGDSYLRYDLSGKRSTLLHFYIRFKPLSPSGTLMRRGSLQSPYVRLSLQKWHICLDASGMSQSCVLSRLCSSFAVESGVWHTVLIAVSSEAAIMRLDDMLLSMKGSFPCDPEFENSAININVGERFNGEIQELILNFKQLSIFTKGQFKVRTGHVPSLASNVAYEKADLDEAYLFLEKDHYLRLPCFNDQGDWRLELTVKPKSDSGLIFFLYDLTTEMFFYMSLENMRIKVKLSVGQFRSESRGSTDYLTNQWLDITLSKKREANTIESTINSGEKIHILLANSTSNKKFEIEKARERRKTKRRSGRINKKTMSLCNDEFFIGNIPFIVQYLIPEELVPFSGIVASLSINNVLIDLHNCSLERNKDSKIQLSSRTASISSIYHETTWGKSKNLNLSCLHSKLVQTHNFAQWLYLDTTVSDIFSNKNVKFVDDGKMLQLISVYENDLKGFYTCRAHSNGYTYNVITYGVLGQVKYSLNSPDLTTIVAVFTTVSLVVCTLSWLFVEGINDLRKGYGFFRDSNFSPEEEAEAVCKYIDQNAHLYSSKRAVKQAKARARRKGRHLASKMSFGAQEPQGLMQMQTEVLEFSNESESSKLDKLPALPEIKSSRIERSNDIYSYICEPSFVSSPQRCTIISSNNQSNPSFEMSRRKLSSRLFLTKFRSPRVEMLRSRRDKTTHHGSSYSDQSRSLKIKSVTVEQLSPVQKVLQKFNELKSSEHL